MPKNTRDIASIPVPIERHETAAWANIQETKPVSRVTVPSEREVRNAKEWVDTNQK